MSKRLRATLSPNVVYALVATATILGSTWRAPAQTPLPNATPSQTPQSGPRLTKQQESVLDSLRREVTDKLLASGKFAAVTVIEPLTLRARKLSGGEITVHLGNSWSAINARPPDRGGVVQRLISTTLAITTESDEKPVETKDQFVSTLRLLVRHRDYLTPVPAPSANTTSPGKALSTATISRPFAGDAVVIVAFDRSESLVLATSGAGKAHGLDDEQLYALAKSETQKLKEDVTRESFGPLRFFGAHEGSYSPSLLLIDGFWDEVEKDLGPGFLIAIPDRTLLLAAPQRNSADLIRAIRSVAQQRKITAHIPHLIQRANSTWVRYANP
jgi:hypothetical protein